MRAVANLVSCVRNPPFGAPLTLLSVFISCSRGQLLNKKFLRPPSCFQDGRHPFLKVVCSLSPDCFYRFVFKLCTVIDITHGRNPIDLGQN